MGDMAVASASPQRRGEVVGEVVLLRHVDWIRVLSQGREREVTRQSIRVSVVSPVVVVGVVGISSVVCAVVCVASFRRGDVGRRCFLDHVAGRRCWFASRRTGPDDCWVALVPCRTRSYRPVCRRRVVAGSGSCCLPAICLPRGACRFL